MFGLSCDADDFQANMVFHATVIVLRQGKGEAGVGISEDSIRVLDCLPYLIHQLEIYGQ